MDYALYVFYKCGNKKGEVAAEKLIHLIENPKTTLIQRMVIDGQLLEGGSVKDIN